MTKTLSRTGAIFIAAVLFILLLAAGYSASAASNTGDKPVFTVYPDLSEAKAGDLVVVSLAIDNATANDVTSFTGKLSFDTAFFTYRSCEKQIGMADRVDYTTERKASGELGFTYHGDEVTNERLNSGESVTFLKFVFTVTAAYDSTGDYFLGTITDCYFGDVNLGQILCRTKGITVRSTMPPTTTNSSVQLSGDASLSSLTVEGQELTPAFNPALVAYTLTVPYETESVRVLATANSSEALVMGEGVKTLVEGTNNFTVTVHAGNGATRDYGLIIIRSSPTTAPSDGITTSTDVTTAPTTEPTTASTLPTSAPTDTPIKQEEETPDSGILQIVGIVFGEIALFFFGFLSGFFVDKNMRRRGERREDYAENDYDRDDDYDRPRRYTPTNPQGYADGEYIDEAYPTDMAYQGQQYGVMQDVNQFGVVQGGFDPNAMQGGFDPSAMQGGFDPNAMQSGFDPSAMQGGFDPNAMQGGFDPNAMQGGFDPNAMQGGFDPNAMQGGYDPNAMQGGFDPNAMQGGFDPNAMQGGFDPNAMQGGFDPNANQFGAMPNGNQFGGSY